MSYQFRFDVEERQLNEIFSDSDISQMYSEVMSVNKSSVEKLIDDVQDYLIRSGIISEFVHVIINDAKVHEDFYSAVKSQVVFLALKKVLLSKKFDVKDSILAIISDVNFYNDILRDRVVYTLSCLTEWRLDDELKAKFLNKL